MRNLYAADAPSITPFKDPKKTEKLKIRAKKVDFSNKKQGEIYVKAEGNVEADYTTYDMFADELIYDEKQNEITAKGNVKVNDVSGDKMRADKVTTNKDYTNASLCNITIEKDKIFIKSELATKENDKYTINNSFFTTCQEDEKTKKRTWHFTSKKTTYDSKKEKVSFSNIFFRYKDVPIAWFPYYSLSLNKNHGFLAPEVTYFNKQGGLALPYFIQNDSRSHYFVIRPQFFVNKATPENISRVNNLNVTHNYAQNNDSVNLDFKIAPNSYSQDETTGSALDTRKTRGYFSLNTNLEKENNSYGFNYSYISDRFFRQSYDQKFENYLTNNIYFNYFSQNNKHSLNLDSLKFTSIAIYDFGQIPKIDFFADYTYENNISKNFVYKGNINSISMSKTLGANQKRISTTHSVRLKHDFSILKGTNLILRSSLEPEIRGDFYHKNYENTNTLLVYGENEKYYNKARAIPSLFLQNTIPINFKFKTNNRFSFKIEPTFNVSYVKEGLNDGSISNEDSSGTLLNSNNILQKSVINGYDFIDDGLSRIYGINLRLSDKKYNIKTGLFGGKRNKNYFDLEEASYDSDYVGKFDLSINNILNIDSNVVYSPDLVLKYSNFNSSLNAWVFTLKFNNTFIDKSYVSGLEQNINENTYGVSARIEPLGFSIGGKIIENNEFIKKDGTTERKVVGLEVSIFDTSDCLEYEIGFRKLTYTNIDATESIGVFGRVRILIK
jgi:LPS-assembly protein